MSKTPSLLAHGELEVEAHGLVVGRGALWVGIDAQAVGIGSILCSRRARELMRATKSGAGVT